MDIVQAMDLIDAAADDAARTRYPAQPAGEFVEKLVQTRAEVRDAVATIVAFVVPGLARPELSPVDAPHQR